MQTLAHSGSGRAIAARPAPHRPRAQVVVGALLVAIAMLAPPPTLARDAVEIINSLCVACHGLDGNPPATAFPRLGGLQAEYIEKQLLEYARGERQNPSMQPFAEGLSRIEMRALAAHYSTQRPGPGVVTNPQLVERGRQVYHEGNRETGLPACAGCHRPDGTGTPRSVFLAGQNAPYVFDQMRLFANEERTNDRGRLMRTVAARMTEEEMRAVAEYIASMR
ncbi:c-type cytochrome [Thioalkalicoccus limnaeus]|uniref:C-type cytochrome n=1 Tax=Thioalkalicoccus limnaeus TaxID=120681 RepID=A0ABV4BBX8_9GAMM